MDKEYTDLVQKIYNVDKQTNYYLIGHNIRNRDEVLTLLGSQLSNEILQSPEMEKTIAQLRKVLSYPENTLFNNMKPLTTKDLRHLLKRITYNAHHWVSEGIRQFDELNK